MTHLKWPLGRVLLLLTGASPFVWGAVAERFRPRVIARSGEALVHAVPYSPHSGRPAEAERPWRRAK